MFGTLHTFGCVYPLKGANHAYHKKGPEQYPPHESVCKLTKSPFDPCTSPLPLVPRLFRVVVLSPAPSRTPLTGADHSLLPMLHYSRPSTPTAEINNSCVQVDPTHIFLFLVRKYRDVILIQPFFFTKFFEIFIFRALFI